MSLDVDLMAVRPASVFSANITHNLAKMASHAGLYEVCWRPEEHGVHTAAEAIPLLRAGLAKLKADPETFRQYDAPNGWGTYEHFVPWVEKYLEACEANPDATIEVSR